MKLLKAGFLVVALSFLVASLPARAHAMDLSAALYGGAGLSPTFNCEGCGQVAESNPTEYGIGFRALAPTQFGIKLGAELKVTYSPKANVSYNGRDVFTATNQGVSLVPMISVPLGDNMDAYVGAGYKILKETVENTRGVQADDTGGGLVATIGIDKHHVVGNLSLGLQGEYTNARYNIENTAVDTAQYAVLVRAGVDF